MTIRSLEIRFCLFALVVALIGTAGVAGGMTLESWWRRLLCFLGLGGLAYFAFIFGVFEFAKRVRPLLGGAEGDGAPLDRWGGRWMFITFLALAVVAVFGLREIAQAESWAERLVIFLVVGGAVLVAGMGAIFAFCALPQVRGQVAAPADEPVRERS